MNLWLDDVRNPSDFGAIGFEWAKTAAEAVALLKTGAVEFASLDHDLGACPTCLNGRTETDWLIEHGGQSMPNCEHWGTGYDVVCWMEEHGIWPPRGVFVHSANPVGAAKMRQAIARHYDEAGA